MTKPASNGRPRRTCSVISVTHWWWDIGNTTQPIAISATTSTISTAFS